MRSIGPAVTREQSPACLRNSNGRLDFPGPTQEASRIPRRNSRIPPQLEKNHVVPPSSQDEALSRYSVSGEVPRDRKSTRLNSSHHSNSYAVFCLKKKKKSAVVDRSKENIEMESFIPEAGANS